MTPAAIRPTMRALRALASAMLLGLVVWLVAPQAVAAQLVALDAGWMGLAVAALSAQIWLSALRWRLTAQALGHPMARGWAAREYGLSVAINSFLPGGVLGDLGRIARSRHLGWRDAVASVMIERLAGQVALIVLAVGAAVRTWGSRGDIVTLAGALAFGVSLVVAMVLMWRFRTLGDLLRRAWLTAGVWQGQALLTLAILTVNVTGFWAAAQAVGVYLDPAAALTLIPLTLLAMLVPLTINGWGLREGVAATLWPVAGIAAAPAVAASVAFGLACMGAALVGMLPWLVARLRDVSPPDASGPDAPGQDGRRAVATGAPAPLPHER